MKIKSLQYLVYYLGILGSIASIVSLQQTPNIHPTFYIVFIYLLCVMPLLFMIQLIRDNHFYLFYTVLRNYFIKIIYFSNVNFNDFYEKICKDNSIVGCSEEEIKNAHSYGKIYITLKPRNIINSVQLSLFSKLKEITSYGIKAEIFLNDFNLDENDIKYYTKILKRFLNNKQYSIYRISKLAEGEFFKNFNIKFEKGTKNTNICWLLHQSAEYLRTSISNDGSLVFEIRKNNCLEETIRFNKKDVSTSDVLVPIYELINLQILLKNNSSKQTHYFVLSGINLREFWTQTKEKLDHPFTPFLIPLIKNLTNDNYATSDDNNNCISLTKGKNVQLLSQVANYDSILEHYDMILFKNLDILNSQNPKENHLHFMPNNYFDSYADLKEYVEKHYKTNNEEKKYFLINNFRKHLNILIDYVN